MPKRIVVLEETREIRFLLQAILTDEGYAVEPFASPWEAVAHLTAVGTDLLLVGYSFQRRADGWQVVEALKRQPETARIPILLCTMTLRLAPEWEGYVVTRAVVLAPTPFDIDDVLDLIEEVIARSS